MPIARPNFLIIGGQRCATGWLAQCLREHPQVYMPTDETRFFDLHYERGLDWWLQTYFSDVAGETAIGEKTAENLYHPDAADRIRRDLPDLKLICCLRHPVQRLCSELHMVHRTEGGADLSRIRELAPPDSRYVRHGFYSEHLRRYIHLFGRDRLLLLVYEERRPDPTAFIRRMYTFLGVDDSFVAPSTDQQVKAGAFEHRHPWLFRVSRLFYTKRLPIRHFYNLFRPPQGDHELRPEDAAYYQELYAGEIAACEELLGRSLDAWRR